MPWYRVVVIRAVDIAMEIVFDITNQRLSLTLYIWADQLGR